MIQRANATGMEKGERYNFHKPLTGPVERPTRTGILKELRGRLSNHVSPKFTNIASDLFFGDAAMSSVVVKSIIDYTVIFYNRVVW